MDSKSVIIAGNDFAVKGINGNRVVSLKDISELHKVPECNLRQNFARNKKHFIKDVDYFNVTGKKACDYLSRGNNVTQLNVFTESGYLMLVKSLTDDLSWQVQRVMVNSYFKIKQLTASVTLFEEVFKYLPDKTRRVLHYLGLGLSVRDTAKLTEINRGTVLTILTEAKKTGFKQPEKSRCDKKVYHD